MRKRVWGSPMSSDGVTQKYVQRKWSVSNASDLEESRTRVAILLSEQQRYLEKIQETKKALTNVTYLKVGHEHGKLQRNTFHGYERKTLTQTTKVNMNTIMLDPMTARKLHQAKEAPPMRPRGRDLSRSPTKRQHSLPALHRQSNVENQLRQPKSRPRKMATHSTTRGSLNSKKAEMIIQLKEAQKWSSFLHKQIQHIDNKIEVSECNMVQKWMALCKIIHMCDLIKSQIKSGRLTHDAARKLQHWWRRRRLCILDRKLKYAIRCIGRAKGILRFQMRCWHRRNCSNIVRQFIEETAKSRFKQGVRRLRWNIVCAQRACRSFLACKKARMQSLMRKWVLIERAAQGVLNEHKKAMKKNIRRTKTLEERAIEKAEFRKRKTLGLTNDSPQTKWKKSLRRNADMDLASVNGENGIFLPQQAKFNETLFDSLARTNLNLDMKRIETIPVLPRPGIKLLPSSPLVSPMKKRQNRSFEGRSQLRPWAMKVCNTLTLPIADPCFVPNPIRYSYLEEILEFRRREFRAQVGRQTFVKVDLNDVKSMMWSNETLIHVLDRKRIGKPIFCLYSDEDINDRELFEELVLEAMRSLYS